MLLGNHHITAFTRDAQKNYHFYHEVLGLQLVKKTVNQDKPDVYHLFYGDAQGAIGSILTFFEEPDLKQTIKGTNALERITVIGQSKAYWEKRLKKQQVTYQLTQFLDYPLFILHDPDDLEVYLLIDEKEVLGEGLLMGPTFLRVKQREKSQHFFEEHLSFKAIQTIDWQGEKYQVMTTTAQAKFSDSLLLVEDKDSSVQRLGVGGIHHIAYGVPDKQALATLAEHLSEKNIRFIPIKDRYYFSSLYVREPNYSVIELATITPGFTVDDPIENFGQTLKLPPFLEKQRAEIEAELPPLTF